MFEISFPILNFFKFQSLKKFEINHKTEVCLDVSYTRWISLYSNKVHINAFRMEIYD